LKKILLYLNGTGKKTIVFFIFCLLSYNGFAQCLSGVYTIGGSNPSYGNMRQAVDALKTVGICGDVIFNIRPGTYLDSLTFTKITGSDTYRIKFKSENNDSTSVIFKHIPSGESYIFQLLSSKNITFEKLTFTLPAVNYASGIKIYSTGENNEGIELLNNRFLGSNRYCTMIDMYGNNHSTVVTIQNNVFIGESNQVSYKGTDTGTAKLKIIRNSFQNAYQGIYAEWADVTVSENKMVCTIKQDYPVGIKLTSAWGLIEKIISEAKLVC
jgi:hypothetical protein